MKLTRLAFGLVLGLAAAGCGSDDNTCGDAACPDSAVGTPDGGATGDTAPLGMITSGLYKATAAVITDDGCKINPMDLVDKNTMMAAWLPVEVTTTTMSVGNPKGTPPTPSLGTGPFGGATFTLKRMNHVKLDAPSMCEYDADVTSTITNDAINSFGIGVVEKQMNRMNCMEPAGVGASCASTFSLRMVKAQ
jgi:hypothetical protein